MPRGSADFGVQNYDSDPNSYFFIFLSNQYNSKTDIFGPFKSSLNLTEIAKIPHRIAKSKYFSIFKMNPTRY